MGGSGASRESGLEKVEGLMQELVATVTGVACAFLTRKTLEDVVAKTIPKDIEDGLSVDARAHILSMSRASYYRLRHRPEPDQYSTVQLIADYLCPIFPGSLTAVQLLAKLSPQLRSLSVELLEEILNYYVGRGILEKGPDGYRLKTTMVWTLDELSSRVNRATNHARGLVLNLVDYVLQERDSGFKVIRMLATPEEYEEFMRDLRQHLNDWYARHPSEAGKDLLEYHIYILSSRTKP